MSGTTYGPPPATHRYPRGFHAHSFWVRERPVRCKTTFAAVIGRRPTIVHRVAGMWSKQFRGEILYCGEWLCGESAAVVTPVLDPTPFTECTRCHDIFAGPGVYRFFGGDGLIYVGSSAQINTRISAHEKKSPWWPEVTRTEIVRYATLAEARTAEAIAIFEEQPRENRRGKSRRPAAVDIQAAA